MAATHPINTGFLSLLLACRQGGYASGVTNVTFPVSFPSACLSVTNTSSNTGNSNHDYTGVNNFSKTGFVRNNGIATFWCAIGY